MGSGLQNFSRRIAPLSSAKNHPLALTLARTELLLSRARLTAAILAVLMVAWIPVDLAYVRLRDIAGIEIARAVAALLFARLVYYHPGTPSPALARVMLGLLLAVPLVFFCYANIALETIYWTEKTLFIKNAYAQLPRLVAMLLCLFPLTAGEGALYGLCILVAVMMSWMQPETPASMMTGVGTLFMQGTVTVIAVIAGMSQLQFMAAFVEHSSKDQMTGCLRRDYGLRLIESLFATARRAKLPLCLAFVDLDHFKSVNDQFGHDTGDRVLAEAGRRFMSLLRKQDAVIRWGGEEFVIVMPGLRLADVPEVMRRLGADGLGRLPDGRVQTASIGAAEYADDKLDTPADVIRLADERMYAAKQGGRNALVTKSGRTVFVPGLEEPAGGKKQRKK